MDAATVSLIDVRTNISIYISTVLSHVRTSDEGMLCRLRCFVAQSGEFLCRYGARCYNRCSPTAHPWHICQQNRKPNHRAVLMQAYVLLTNFRAQIHVEFPGTSSLTPVAVAARLVRFSTLGGGVMYLAESNTVNDILLFRRLFQASMYYSICVAAESGPIREVNSAYGERRQSLISPNVSNIRTKCSQEPDSLLSSCILDTTLIQAPIIQSQSDRSAYDRRATGCTYSIAGWISDVFLPRQPDPLRYQRANSSAAVMDSNCKEHSCD